MAGSIAVDGLASGFDTTAMIDKMLSVEQRSVTLLATRQQRANNQLAAFQALNTKLLAVLTDARSISRPAAFGAKTVTTSNPDAMGATVTSAAAPGTYAITVTSLARSHQVASQGFADTDTTLVGAGTLQIQVGSGAAKTLTLDSTNNTLAGLRDAINASGAGVAASIVNDGSAIVPYRLLLSANSTGAANTISVTADLTGGTAPSFGANSISQAVADSANTYSGTATSGGAYTGSAGQAYLAEIVQGGSLAEATYRVSEDGGTTWGTTQSLAGGTIGVYDDTHGSNLGVTASFTEGTFAAGDRFRIDAFVPTVQTAADAQVTIGSGAGKITVSSASNTVADVLPGVTLTLKEADPDKPVQVTVQNDAAAVQQSIQSFVDHYNSVVSTIRDQTRYDPKTQQAGILLGNASVLKIQQDLREAVIATVPGLSASMNNLTAIGITLGSTGQLTVDSSKLSAALRSNPDAVARLFQATGTSTNSKIAFVASGASTRANAAGYTVQITQAAERGALVGASVTDPAVSPLTIDASNDKLVFNVNGETSGILSLAHKTYHSGTELATELQAQINADPALHEHVDVSFVDEGATGHFEIRTQTYGASRSVALSASPSNGAASVLGLDTATATAGQDVAGTIDGFDARGTGQTLEVIDARSPAAGLRLQVSLAPADLAARGTAIVSVTKGAGKRAEDLLGYLTDASQGYVKNKEDRLTTESDNYGKQIKLKNDQIERHRQKLVDQFTKLEATLSQLKNQSSMLSAQLASLTSMMSTSSSRG
jgi:flagellar hook-associated protein 2